MAISLSFLMALTIALVAAITGIVCFVPTYTAGVGSVTSAVDNVRTNLVTLASERLTAYFAKPRILATLMQYNSARGRLDSSNITAMMQLSVDIAFDNIGVFTAVNFILNDENNFVSCNTANLLNGQFGGLPGIITLAPDKASIQAFRIDNVTHTAVPGTMYFNAPIPIGIPVAVLTPLSLAMMTDPSLNTVWMPPTLAWDGTSIVMGTRLVHPDGSFRGAFYMDVSSVGILHFLKTLGLRAGGRTIAWHNGTGFVLGLSWDEPVVLLTPQWQDLTLPAAARGTLRQPDNFSDPLVRNVFGSLGGFAEVQSLPLPYTGKMGSGKHTTYVDIVAVRDAYGLDVKILLAMPQIDFLEDVYRQQVRTLAGVCSGVALMIFVAFGIGHLMAAPLKRLAERMELTASFDDNEEDDPPSHLAEVASMQASYSLMKAQLNRAKTFLPQSVVAVQEDDEETAATTLLSSGNRDSRSPSQSGRDTEVGTSRSSHRKTVISSAAGAVVGALNVDLGLSARCVTVVAFNLHGFIRCASSARRCTEVQGLLLSTLQRIVRENRGMIDYFQGDRILTSFNAVTNTVAHGRRAIVSAVTAIRELREHPSMPLQASAGVCQGMALCGNMGTQDMRRFSILGYPVVQAVALERLTKLYAGVHILMPGWMENDAQLELYYQAVDIVRLPGGGQRLDPAENKTSCLLLAPTQVKQVRQDEWMYELKQGDDTNPFQHVNNGFRHLVAGDIPAAKRALAARPPSEIDAVGASMLNEHIEKAESGGGKAVPRELGLFYNAALLGLPQCA